MQQQQQPPAQTPGRAPLRADHSLLLLPLGSRACLQAAAAPLRPCPVATVAPLKRRLALPVGDFSCESPAPSASLPPAAKLARRHEAGGGIATNPRYRRRSQQQLQQQQQQQQQEEEEKEKEKEKEEKQQQQPQAETRDAQTSPMRAYQPSGASPMRPTSRRSPLLASAGGWARKRLAHIRRSLSSSRVDAVVAASANSSSNSSSNTSSTCSSPLSSNSGVGTPRRRERRRQSSLQRLVHRLAPSPKSLATFGLQQQQQQRQQQQQQQQQPAGCVLHLHRDGSRTVRLRRQRDAKFGFFVAMQADGVYLSRFNDSQSQSRYRNLISIGDKIVEIEGHRADSMQQQDIFAVIADRRDLQLRVSTPGVTGW